MWATYVAQHIYTTIIQVIFIHVNGNSPVILTISFFFEVFMETFGSWLQKLRKDSGIDLRTIGQISGIHFTSVGRIEKGQNDPTIESSIRIVITLKGNPIELCQLVTGKTPPSPHSTGTKTHSFPTLEEVIHFERLIREKPQTTGEYFAQLLNKITNLESPDENIYRQDLLPGFLNNEIEWFYESLKKPTFSAIDIQKFLLYPSPSNISSIYKPLIIYPEKLDSRIIFEIFLNNGVLLPDDFIRYVVNKFENSDIDINTNDKTIIRKYIKIQQIITRLEGQNNFSGIKLSDIILLDNELSKQGEIFMMAWNAASEEIRVKSKLNASNAARLLIIVSRYLASLNNPKPDWLFRLQTID